MLGPGVWELRANKTSRDETKYKTTSTMTAIPTPTHMMFVKLHKVSLLAHQRGTPAAYPPGLSLYRYWREEFEIN